LTFLFRIIDIDFSDEDSDQRLKSMLNRAVELGWISNALLARIVTIAAKNA
jgi:hypothetical protein